MSDEDFGLRDPGAREGRMPRWAWVLLLVGGSVVLVCAGLVGSIVYMIGVGPDTKIYSGAEVPQRFLDTARRLGVVDEGEQVLFFYSDALTDVEEGMYLVTDGKVGMYIEDAAQPLQLMPFELIRDVDISRGSSWLEDSTITLVLTDDSVVCFPASIEGDRDQRMFEAIRKRMKGDR